jgi:hypothetical protein
MRWAWPNEIDFRILRILARSPAKIGIFAAVGDAGFGWLFFDERLLA